MQLTDLLFYLFKAVLVIFSGLTTGLCLLFMLSPGKFRVLEEMLGLEIGWETSFTTVLEGRITVINDWIFKYHIFFGPLLALVAAWNTRNAFFM